MPMNQSLRGGEVYGSTASRTRGWGKTYHSKLTVISFSWTAGFFGGGFFFWYLRADLVGRAYLISCTACLI